ncbi:FAD-binding protein, partial [Massilia sp. CCM 8733]
MHIHQDRLLPNEFLEAEEFLLSSNGRYTFVYQGDGNLVLYKFRPDGSRNWLWDSQTNRKPVGRCIMQGDGNLVIYGPTGNYVWDSGTGGKNDSWLVIQDDGNAVIYLPNGAPVWATNTVQPAMGKVTDEELKNWSQNRRTAVAGHCYPEHLDELVAIVKEAERQGRCVRAVGSKWSGSDVAMTPDYVVETDQLAGIVTDVLEASPAILISSASHLNLVHVEAGIKLVDLNRFLDGKDLAMPVLGGSSGQSLAGALSTSVHGADFEMGPLPDIVRAIHLVGPGGIQYWIEPTAGITDRDRLSALLSIPKENIRHDDAWFNSVLVSMGALGIIYSVIIEVRPQYNLIANCEHLNWDTMRARLRAGTAFVGKRAVQVVVSQFKHDDGTRPCFLTTRTESVKTSPFVGGLSADLTRILAGLSIELLNVAPQTYPAIVKAALFQSLNAGTTEGWAHTIMCSPPPPPAIGLGLEFAFDANNDAYLDFVDAALELLDTAYQNEALGLGGWLSLRFVGHSRAYLSPQHASTRTCMVEFTGAAALKSTKPLLTRLEAEGRAHGGIQHWGMFDDLQVGDVARAYPELDRWRQVRWELTNGGMLGTFDNAFTIRCGLSQAPGANIQLWHNEQTASGVSAPWTDWHELAKPANKAKMLALIAHPDGRMHAAMTGLDGQIWHNEQTAVGVSAPWTDWHALSNPGNKAKTLSLAAH